MKSASFVPHCVYLMPCNDAENSCHRDPEVIRDAEEGGGELMHRASDDPYDDWVIEEESEEILFLLKLLLLLLQVATRLHNNFESILKINWEYKHNRSNPRVN